MCVFRLLLLYFPTEILRMDIVHSVGFAQHTAIRHVPMLYPKQNWKCGENPLGFRGPAFPICQFSFKFITYLFSLLSLLFKIHFQYLCSLEKLMSVSWLPTHLKQWPSSMLQGLCSRCTENSRLGHSPGKDGPLCPGDHHGSSRRAEGLEAVAVAGSHCTVWRWACRSGGELRRAGSHV